MSDPNRRDFLKFLASLAFMQAGTSAKPFRIDIHHHFGPAVWVAEVKRRPLLQPANTTWTPAKSLEDMDRGAVAVPEVSVTNPGLRSGDKALPIRLPRAVNQNVTKLAEDRPNRHARVAVTPQPADDAT